MGSSTPQISVVIAPLEASLVKTLCFAIQGACAWFSNKFLKYAASPTVQLVEQQLLDHKISTGDLYASMTLLRIARRFDTIAQFQRSSNTFPG